MWKRSWPTSASSYTKNSKVDAHALEASELKWTVGTKIGAGFGLALLIVIILGTVTYKSTSGMVATSHWVDHSHKILAELEDVLPLMEAAELAECKYVMTGSERDLEPFRKARTSIDEELREVETDRKSVV